MSKVRQQKASASQTVGVGIKLFGHSRPAKLKLDCGLNTAPVRKRWHRLAYRCPLSQPRGSYGHSDPLKLNQLGPRGHALPARLARFAQAPKAFKECKES